MPHQRIKIQPNHNMSATGLPPPMIKRSSFENMTTGPVEMRHLRPNEVYSVAEGIGGVKVEVEWTSTTNGLADLDVYVLLYDENVSIMCHVDIGVRMSSGC